MNVQGEEQKKLDVISNDVLKNALRSTGEPCVCATPQYVLLARANESENESENESKNESENERENESDRE